MMLFSCLWLLNKYKDYPEIIINSIKILDSIITNMKYNKTEEIVNENSYEILDIDDEETKMKKNVLIGGLVVFLMAGLIGCPTGDDKKDSSAEEGEGTGNKIVEKVVEEKYRGVYRHYHGGAEPIDDLEIRITEKQYTLGEYKDGVFVVTVSCPAYNEGVMLYEAIEGPDSVPIIGIESGRSKFLIGSFNPEESFTRVDEITGVWIKK